MKKPFIFAPLAAIIIIIFLYFDYQKNRFDYIILSKKLEIIANLFFNNSFSSPLNTSANNESESHFISYEKKDNEQNFVNHFIQGDNYSLITMPQDIYKTGLAQHLRKLFNHYAKLDLNKEEDKKIIEKITKIEDAKGRLLRLVLGFNGVAKYDEDLQKRNAEYINLFSKKFIVTSIAKYKYDEKCGKNSYDIGVIIDSNPIEDLTIGLTNSGEICFVWDENYRLYKYEIQEFIKLEKYKNYWL